MIRLKGSVPCVLTFIRYCAVMLYIINYIYYKVLKIQICSSNAEPTLEPNRSLFIIIANTIIEIASNS